MVARKHKNIKMKDLLEKKDSAKTKINKPKKVADKQEEPIPRGKPKSGRIWKSAKKKFTSIIKTKGVKNPYQKKEALRNELQRVKELSRSIKAHRVQEKELKKQRRRENLQRQEENRKKSEVVQVITNTVKLKRMKKKHLRTVEKRDTLKM